MRIVPQSQQIRTNGKIRAREVLVIGPDGDKLGVLKIEDALARARAVQLDLIEVAPGANPPVCKIVDWGKYRYQQAKHDREARRGASASRVKEVKLRPNIAQHDYMTKLRLAEAFLDKGMKVKLTLMFRGREMQHTSLGFDVVNRICDDLLHIGNVETKPKLAGRSINTMIAPLPANKRIRKYSQPSDNLPDEDEEDHDESGDADADSHSAAHVAAV
jgi:translation initiation factor IF-3